MANLCVQGLPQRTFVGLDLITFNSSPQFRGITNIPAGIHLLYYGTDPSLSIRHGCWLDLKHSDNSVWSWDAREEVLKYRTAHGNGGPVTDGLGFINYEALGAASGDARLRRDSSDGVSTNNQSRPTWTSLTSHFNAQELSRLIPVSSTTFWQVSSLSSSAIDTETIPGLTAQEAASVLSPPTDEKPLRLLPIDLSRTFSATATGRDRTNAARDRSWYLGHLLDSLCEPHDEEGNLDLPRCKNRSEAARHIIGELQFAFLMTLLLASYSCMQGWKRILEVVFTCESAVVEIAGFFAEALRVLYAQVIAWDEVEGGLFQTDMDDSTGQGGGLWLRRLLRRFRATVQESLGWESDVGIRLKELEDLLRARYGWDDLGGTVLRRGMLELEDGERVEVSMEGADEEEEKGDWAPVVVDLDGVKVNDP